MDLVDAVNLTLWWAEGSKLRKNRRWNGFIYSVEVTNTDPIIITMFLKYLRVRLGVQENRIKVQLQIHEGDDVEELVKFWEEKTGISRQLFNKTIIRPVGNKVGKSKGTCKIRVHDKQLFLKLAGMLEELRGVVHR